MVDGESPAPGLAAPIYYLPPTTCQQMINGNQTWQSGLTSLQKQPLYVLQIPQFGIVLASFTQSQIQPLVHSGYGAMTWGVGGWGT